MKLTSSGAIWIKNRFTGCKCTTCGMGIGIGVTIQWMPSNTDHPDAGKVRCRNCPDFPFITAQQARDLKAAKVVEAPYGWTEDALERFTTATCGQLGNVYIAPKAFG